MSKNLVIIEAPNKAKKISQYLGSDYHVAATKGHIADLPEKDLGVDLKKDFDATYEVSYDKQDLVDDLVDRAKKAKHVYLMTDKDREGEAIAWMVANQLPKSVKYSRVSTGSITKTEIQKAIKNAGSLNDNMIAAFETRRILDRLAGYKTSWLVRRATGGSSAGRVQSAGLRVLADREKEIKAFVPEEYWPIAVELLTEDKEKVLTKIKDPNERDIKTGEQAKEIVEAIRGNVATVTKFEKKEVVNKAYAPFTTSTMYQQAGGFLGWSSKKTASVAQKLYEAGVITYHRTDSTYVVPEAIEAIRGVIGEMEDEYLPKKPNLYGNAANAQEAHEACRPTEVANREYAYGSGDEAKLYKMIWKRAVSSQMTPMRKLSISAEFSVDKYKLSANGSKLLFDGWRAVWDYGSILDTELPEMTVGQNLDVIDVQTEQKFTQPPPRYTEKSFVKLLDKLGIGRPSTYASIIETLRKRDYITGSKSFEVTDLGLKVNDFLVGIPFCFSDTSFTADMEQRLDDIVNSKADKVTVLKEFWTRLQEDIKKAKDFKKEVELTEHKCDDCDSFLAKRRSKFGEFLGCSNYPDCKSIYDLDDDGKPVKKVKKEKEYSDEFDCPKCDGKMVKRSSKVSGFWGCDTWPKCDGKRDLEGNPLEFSKKKKRYGKKKTKRSKKKRTKKSKKSKP